MTYSNLKSYLNAGLICCLLITTSCRREAIADKEQAITSARTAHRGGPSALLSSCGGPADEHIISLSYAYQLVDNYRLASQIPDKICQLYDQGGWVLAETFPAGAIQAVLDQTGICGFRVYNGLDVDNRQHLVLVGVDHNGFDVLSKNHGGHGRGTTETSNPNDDDPGLIVEMGYPCPRACTGVYKGS